MNQLTTIAALPGMGGGCMAAMRAEVAPERAVRSTWHPYGERLPVEGDIYIADGLVLKLTRVPLGRTASALTWVKQ